MIVGSYAKFADNSQKHMLKIKRGHEARWASLFVTRVILGISATSQGIQECQSPKVRFFSIPTLDLGRQSVGSLDMSAEDQSRALSCGEILRGVLQ